MTTDKLRKILARGEDITTEYKKCTDRLSDSVYETVCSFSNRYGGYLLLGVADDGTVLGVNIDTIGKLKKDFANMLNNPQKMSPALYLSLENAEIDGKMILWTYVPLTSQVQKCVGRIYDRNEDGDFDITDSPILAGDLYSRKAGTFTERRVFQHTTLDDLRLDLIPRVKKSAMLFRDDHPWQHMDDMELFRSAGLYENKDQRTGLEGFNLAGILLFGRDETIRSCAPGYTTDCLLRRADIDRYDDRLMVETNLIESYDLIMEFIAKHTEDRFQLIDDRRVSIRTKIAREVVGNLLMHREYSSAFPARLIIEKEQFYTENWSWAKYPGRITLDNATPFSKNPLIAHFFMNIGRADALGSGIKNLYQYTKMYSGREPELIEGDVFKIIVPIERNEPNHDPDSGISESNMRSDRIEQILEMLADDSEMTYNMIAKKLEISRSSVMREIKKLKDSGILYREGGTRGVWKIVKKN
jgi:ATP-dependent DNA helicase RecG